MAAQPAVSLAQRFPEHGARDARREPAVWSSRSHALATAAHAPTPPATAAPILPATTTGAGGVPAAPLPAPGPLPWSAERSSVTRGSPEGRRVLLSFDGGSEANSSEAILDTLAREGVRTTFFLTGDFIRNHPEVMRTIVLRGHEIGNHTDHHVHLTTWEQNRRHDTRPGLTRAAFLAELEGARQALRQVAGVEIAPLWRAPYGEVNGEILRWASEAGYLHVGWTRGLDSLDWVSDPDSRNYRTPEEFLAVLARRHRQDPLGLNGAIILMHLHSNRPPAERFHRRLGDLVRWLRGAGYELVTASEIAAPRGLAGQAPEDG